MREKRLNRCQSNRVFFGGWSILVRLHDGEEAGLGGGGGKAGAVGLGALAGQAVAVKGRFREEVECLGGETEFVLRNGLAASFAFHGGQQMSQLRELAVMTGVAVLVHAGLLSGGFGVCREVGLILVAGVAAAACGVLAARVLPCLAFPVPMESKL
jgi:hypothetical protein